MRNRLTELERSLPYWRRGPPESPWQLSIFLLQNKFNNFMKLSIKPILILQTLNLQFLQPDLPIDTDKKATKSDLPARQTKVTLCYSSFIISSTFCSSVFSSLQHSSHTVYLTHTDATHKLPYTYIEFRCGNWPSVLDMWVKNQSSKKGFKKKSASTGFTTKSFVNDRIRQFHWFCILENICWS